MAKIIFWLVLVTSYYLLPCYCSTSSDNFTFEARPERTNALSTRNFTLNCNYQSEGNIKIVSILLSKRTRNGANTTEKIASLANEPGSHVYSSPDILPGGKYTGRISMKKGFLSGRWTIVPQGICGTYTCTVNILDNVGHLQSMQKSVNVVEEAPDSRHTVAALKEIQRFDQNVSLKLAKIQVLIKRIQLLMSAKERKEELEHRRTKASLQQMQAYLQQMQTFDQRVSLKLAEVQRFIKGYQQRMMSPELGIGIFMAMDCCARNTQFGRRRKYIAFTHQTKTVTHSWAREYCMKAGGYLMELNNDYEWKIVAALLRGAVDGGYYIAGVRGRGRNKSKFYVTRTGRKVAPSSKWGPDGANNALGIENCLELYKPIRWKLNDVSCWVRSSFICEIPTRY